MLHVNLESPSAPPAPPGLSGRRNHAGSRVLLALALTLGATLAAAGPRLGAAAAPVAADPATTPTPPAPEVAGALPAAPPLAVPAVLAAAPKATAGAGGLGTTAVPAVFRDAAGLSPRALAMALDAVSCARSRGIAGRDDMLTLIDYSLPSTEPRLWVLDLAHGKVLFHELVAHGAGSGDNHATRFSNTLESRQTSLGLFLTAGTYEGGKGYSLRLRGLDPGVNDRAESRNIVMHGAWYVSASHAQQFGRLGRSWGCPALPVESARPVIDTIKDGSFVFSYAAGAAGDQALPVRASQASLPSRSSTTSQAAYRPACAVPAPAAATVAAAVGAVAAP
jgi:hypothetical protein